MSPKKPLKSTDGPAYKPIGTTKTAKGVNIGLVVSTALVEVGQLASIIGLQHAAMAAQAFIATIDRVQANKGDFVIIANDASDLIVAIWELQKKSKDPKKWISPEVRDMVANLKKTIDEVDRFALKQTARNMAARIVFNMTDAARIRQSREKINQAVAKFQVLSHLKEQELLLDVQQGMNSIRDEQIRVKEREEAEAEEEEEEEQEEEEEEEEEEEPPPPSSNQPTWPGPTPFAAPTTSIHGFNFSNTGGKMFNQNVGNIVNTNISNIGNNYSRNYVYD